MDNQEANIKYCPNCGASIEPSQKFCKSCGIQLLNARTTFIQSNTNQLIEEKPKSFFKKINIKSLIPALALIILLIIIFSATTNSLTPREKYALSKTEYLIEHAKDPDSFKLQSNIVYVKLKVDGNDYYDGKDVYFIEYSARNGFGGNVKSIACFFDGEYIDLDKDIEKVYESDYSSNSDYIDALEDSLKEYGPVMAMNKYLSEWNLLGSSSDSFEESEIISAKKIAKKAKCECYE